MPIYMADAMTHLTVMQITGDDTVRSHLANLGFVPGASVMLVSKIDDNIIVKIKGVSLAINRDLAKRILV